jgi:hypothetical protein
MDRIAPIVIKEYVIKNTQNFHGFIKIPIVEV